jgi:rSAM/selenodomain-associated transferase 2
LISIITPILNEEKQITRFLNNLNYLQGIFEVVLVDGESSDNTIDKAAKSIENFNHPIKLLSSKQGRAIQMNKGAKAAKGDIFLFLHSDCQIPKDALHIIENKISKQTLIGGGFKHTFSNSNMILKLISTFGNIRASLSQIFYGDFGFFLRNDIFNKIGGYDETSFLEDVDLCKKAKRHGKLCQINRYIWVSPRRFLAQGKATILIAYVAAVSLNFLSLKPLFLNRIIRKI